MSSVDTQLFPTITGAHWRTSTAMRRARRNQVAAQIRAALGKSISAASGGTVMGKEDGLGNSPAGQPPLARGVVSPATSTILSPVAPQPNTTRGDESSVNGNATGDLFPAPPLTESRLHGVGPARAGSRQAAGLSCSVGRAAAGRDRRNFVLS